jgi:hypothetical protein
VGRFEEIIGRSGNDVYVEFSGIVRAGKPVSRMDQASVSARLRIRENRLVLHDGSIDCSGVQTKWQFVEGGTPQNPALQVGGVRFALQILATFQMIGPGGYHTTGHVPHETSLQYNETSTWLGAIPSSLLRSIHPVYALRGFEEWGYPITEYPPASLELMTLHDRALALPNALASDRRLKERLSDQLEQLLHISIDYEVIPGKRLKVWAKPSVNNARETLFVNEGTGANQIPFILVPVLLTPPNETILLSEPEAHLHPRAQSELTALLLTIAKKQNLQFFIETHSEHVLHRLLHAVAKADLTPDELAIYYFLNEKGLAKVRPLKIDKTGGVEGGLPGFFDQSLDELSEYLDALKGIKT